MVSKIYVDMDGVIADFDAAYSSIYGCFCRDDPDKEKNFYEAVHKHEIFKYLERMQDAQDLINELNKYDVEIALLSCATPYPNYDQVCDQKEYWARRRFPEFVELNFTYTKEDKGRYAKSDVLLIDDSQACIDAFSVKGGMTILHKNAKDTIMELSRLHSKGLINVRDNG